jgi:hypothetical protein
MKRVEEHGPPRIFLLVPDELAGELLETLEEHYRGDPAVTPVVDRREGPRRKGVDRRMLRLPAEGERRDTPEERRKLADRRAPLLPRDLSHTLPPAAAAHAGALRWVQRLDPVSPQHAALPTQSLVDAIAAGQGACTTELYWRCFERVYQRLREHMDALTADANTKAAFGYMLDRLQPGDPTPFDTFLGRTVEEFAAGVSQRGQAPL